VGGVGDIFKLPVCGGDNNVIPFLYYFLRIVFAPPRPSRGVSFLLVVLVGWVPMFFIFLNQWGGAGGDRCYSPPPPKWNWLT